jgi:hypothetical protein
MRSALEQAAVKVLGKMKPSLDQSQFLAQGVLTPQEFVEAGDLLVYKVPGHRPCVRCSPPSLPRARLCSAPVFSSDLAKWVVDVWVGRLLAQGLLLLLLRVRAVGVSPSPASFSFRI